MPDCPPTCLSCHALRSGVVQPSERQWVHSGHAPDIAASAPRSGWLVDLHAGHSAPHDHLAGVGSFDTTVSFLASKAGEDVHVATWIARPNFRNLGSMPPLLAKLGVKHWRLRVVRSAPASHWDRLTPRLALALPRALHAADKAMRLGIEVSIEGAPSCLLGPMSSLAAEAPAGDFAPGCSACALHATCVGVAAEYLARFGGEDLRPVRSQ